MILVEYALVAWLTIASGNTLKSLKVETIPGFASQEQCEIAAKAFKDKSPRLPGYSTLYVDTVCLKVK